MRSREFKSLLLLLTLLTACSSKSSADDPTKELEKVTSWAATAQMAGDAWINGKIPAVYAKQTLSKAQTKLQQETGRLAHSSTEPTQQRNILQHLQRLKSTVGQMATAVEHKDHSAMSQQLKQLSTQKQMLSTLANAAGGNK